MRLFVILLIKTYRISKNLLQNLVTFLWQKKLFFCHKKVTKFCSKFLEILYVLINKIKKSLIYRGILKSFSAYKWDFRDLMFNYWYWKKNDRNFYEPSNSEQKMFLWWRRMIGALWFCFQTFHIWSSFFDIWL